MSKNNLRFDQRKVNSELLSLSYGALVMQIIKDYDKIEDVNKQLERLGYNIGLRLIEDFLAKTSVNKCLDFRDTAEKIQVAFKMYLGIQPVITNWTSNCDEFSLIIDSNPLIDFVELPDQYKNLKYCILLCGVIRGALEMVNLEVRSWIVQDQLKSDVNTEIRVKFIRKTDDLMPNVDN